MPYDSNGNASLVPSYFVQDGDDVLPVQHNPPLEDIAAMLSMALVRDGRAPMSGNLNMGVNKITNLAPPTNPNDAARLQDIPTSGETSIVIYEESDLNISSAAYLTIEDIPEGLRALELDLSINSISANPGIATLLISIGDGTNWFELGASTYGFLTQWTNSGTAARSLTARISCLDDEDLPITLASVNNNLTPNTISVDVCQPDELAARPVVSVRIRLQTQSGVATVFYRKVRLRGIYA